MSNKRSGVLLWGECLGFDGCQESQHHNRACHCFPNPNAFQGSSVNPFYFFPLLEELARFVKIFTESTLRARMENKKHLCPLGMLKKWQPKMRFYMVQVEGLLPTSHMTWHLNDKTRIINTHSVSFCVQGNVIVRINNVNNHNGFRTKQLLNFIWQMILHWKYGKF